MPRLLPFLLCGFLIACLLFLATDKRSWQAVKANWKPLSLILLLALLWRLPFDGHFFYGLEYEDSYIYSVAARQLNSATRSCAPAACYLTTVCVVGNGSSCEILETSSGHFIGYPFMVAAVSRVLGYTPAIASYLSLIASLVTVVLVFIAGQMISGEVAGLASALILSLTPAFAVYGVGTFAEPVSNMLVVMCLIICVRVLRLTQDDSPSQHLVGGLALVLTATFAITVKRENLLLIPVMLLASLIVKVENSDSERRIWWGRLSALIGACVCVAFAVFDLRLGAVVRSERVEYGVFPFNLTVLRTMLPLFLKSYASINWYLGMGIFVLLGVVITIRSRKSGTYPASLFGAYLLLYAFHVRSYYFQERVAVATASDTLRYTMNLAGLWSILAGLGLSFLIILSTQGGLGRWVKRQARTILWLAFGAYALTSWFVTDRWKEDTVANETTVRLEPAEAALHLAGEFGISNTFVIGAEPLVVQMLAKDPVNVLGFRYLSSELVEGLLRKNPDLTFLYLEQAIYNSPVDRSRYKTAFAFLDNVQKTQLYRGSNYSVYRIDLPGYAYSP